MERDPRSRTKLEVSLSIYQAGARAHHRPSRILAWGTHQITDWRAKLRRGDGAGIMTSLCERATITSRPDAGAGAIIEYYGVLNDRQLKGRSTPIERFHLWSICS